LSGPNPQQSDQDDSPRTRRDLSSSHPEGFAIALGIGAVLLFVASVGTGVAGGLPTVAFGWTFGLEVFRAAVVFAIIAVVAIVLIRGWTGEWPSNFSTSGLGYREAAEVSEAAVDLGEAQAIVDLLRPAVEAANRQARTE
jgi:hypothetical protein